MPTEKKSLIELQQELEELISSPIPEDATEFNKRLDRKKELENEINNYELDFKDIENDHDQVALYLKALNNRLDRDIEKAEQFLNDSEVGPKSTTAPEQGKDLPPSSPPDAGPTSEPFKILGIGDDGRAAFITEERRFVKWALDSLSKNKLIVLAAQSYWNAEFPQKKGTDWDEAIDYLIRKSQRKDFNEENIRGRGAWRDGNKISYHDGIKTIGEYDKKKIYLRLLPVDIGILDKPINQEIPKLIKKVVFKMSFETPADAVRCLGWSVLAPFAGALKYRPALLMTGPSGTGKTTIADLIMNKIALPKWLNGYESTAAYIYQSMGKNSGSIVIDEAEGDDDKGKRNRNDQLSLMRSSTSDNAPDSGKGGKDGNPITYKMKSMFAFISVDPTIDRVADENRIFRINTVKPNNENDWKKIEDELYRLLSEKNCRAIRALTWQKLKTILELAEKIVDQIRKKTGRDYRSSYSDAMLASAFIVIFDGTDDPTEEQIDKMLDKYYDYQPAEEHRDEAEEIIERLMNEVIEILHDHDREKLTIMECLNRIYTGKKKVDTIEHEIDDKEIDDYKLHVARYGIRLTSDYDLAIQNNHHLIKKIIERGNGYSKILKRHYGLIDSQRNIHFFDGKSPRCTVLRGVIEKKWEDKSDQEQLEDIIV